MNGEQSALLEILNAIEHGNLSTEETRRRLEELIDNEINKTNAPANMEIVDECEKLLWELNTKGHLPFESNLEKNKNIVLSRLKQSKHPHSRRTILFRIPAIAASLFFIAIGSEILLHREWIWGQSTNDEQQFVIQGQVVDPNTIESGVAEDPLSSDYLVTDDYNKVVSFFNRDLLADFSIPSNYEVEKYECFVSDISIDLFINFKNSNIEFGITSYSSVQNIQSFIEQNSNGTLHNIHGHDVYTSFNYETILSTWMDVNSVYTVTGDITEDECFNFINGLYTKGIIK